MVCKNFHEEFTFVCHTEDPTNIHPDIKIIPLDLSLDLEVWWWKLVLFREQTDEVNMFFDLDNVIQGDITHYKDYVEKDKLMMIKAYWKPWLEDAVSNPKRQFDMNLNSSVLVWSGDLTPIWNMFYDNIEYFLMKYKGIDSYLCFDHPDMLNFFPRGEIYSRAYGIDENDYWYTPGSHGPEKMFYSDQFNICIFNGWKRRTWADKVGNDYILDDEGYIGYEKYFD
tara:strand:- start:316 stop:990 length:675 start_codon:yes stop_codon:yes gene_type:complete